MKEILKTIINGPVMGAFPSQLLDECAEYVMNHSFAEGSTPSWEAYKRVMSDMIYVPMFQIMEIHPKVLAFLNESAPQAWFKPMFMTKAQREAEGMNF